MATFLEVIIFALGIIYTIVWSISFYFQLFLNYKLRSSEGYSLDFQYMNLFGFTYLSISNVHYMLENNISANSIIDLGFSVHALLISIVLYSQTFFFPRGVNRGNFGSYMILIIIALMIVDFYILDCKIYKGSISDVWIFMGLSKSLMSTFKYTYQLFLNYDRKNTRGFSVENVWLDFTGGYLSLIQTVLQNYHDGTSILDGKTNVPKLLLSCVVMLFDILLLLQHYVMYKDEWKKPSETPLTG